MNPDAATPVHATAIALGNKGCLILGPSGAGKSTFALNLISLGAELVADDRCILARRADKLIATAPPDLPKAIEVRGVGLLNCPIRPEVSVDVVVDLGMTETERLPKQHDYSCLGVTVPCFHNPATEVFPLAIRHYLLHGSYST